MKKERDPNYIRKKKERGVNYMRNKEGKMDNTFHM